MEVEITDVMDHLEDTDWKKSSRTCTSAFAPTGTSIESFLAGIPEYHSTVGGITVQYELKQLWKGESFARKQKRRCYINKLQCKKGLI